jgi:hypothetical protein
VKSVRKRKRKAATCRNQRDTERAAAKPAGALLDETIAIWQPRTSRRLTREDARQIIENMTGFFNVLREWDRAERAAAAAEQVPARKHPSNSSCPQGEPMLDENTPA